MTFTVLVCLNCKATYNIHVDYRYFRHDLDQEQLCCQRPSIDFDFLIPRRYVKRRVELKRSYEKKK